MNDKKNYDFNVSVQTHYIAERSDTAANRFVFAYSITISNNGKMGAQLISRHWIITDSNDQVQHVHGDGVVGEQPYIRPGYSHQYTSGTILDTPVGTMEGSYQMVADDGTEFEAEIPQFILSAKSTLH